MKKQRISILSFTNNQPFTKVNTCTISRKVHDQIRDGGVKAEFLTKQEASEYVDRYFAMNFTDKTISMNNFKVDEECVELGDKRCKVYSLVDVDYASLPGFVRPYTNIEVNNTSMPVDLLSHIDSIPGAETVIYNQMIYMPNQKRELALLDKKKNRHASIPNPSNEMAVEDIKRVQEVIARESKQLVYTHYNLMVCTPKDADMQKCTNHLENQFGRMGIHISKRAYNQLELSRIESGNMTFSYSTCNLNNWVDSMYLTHSLLIPKEIEFIKEVPDAAFFINTDVNRLSQIMTNFLNNATKFPKSGYINLGYEIDFSTYEVSIYVEDTGKGIPKEEQRMIFERFYKQDEFVQGTGLGLSISMVIAEKLGGKISVASEIGKGSRFTFLLPYHNESEEFFSAG